MGFRTVSGARLEQFAHKRLHIGVGNLTQFVTSELGNQMSLQQGS